MQQIEVCPECGVPKYITSEHSWLNNGDIVQSRNQKSRMIFIETENLDPLFKGIEQIIGMPIEHMVITAGRRAIRGYLRSFIPEKVRQKIKDREIDYGPIDYAFADIARINGIGSFESVERRYEQDEHDFDTISISEPHSIPLTVASHVGAIELLTGFDQSYKYEEVAPDTYHITVFPSPHPEELKKRLWFHPHEHVEGDVELAKCATCGGPEALSGYKWFPKRGIIVNKTTRRRMAIQGDVLLDPIFQELERELGAGIPRVVVEAQRRFTKSGFYTMDDISDEGDFRAQLAFRGLGNLKELSMKKTGLYLRLENVALPLIVMGIAQGFFEMGFGLDSTDIDWELTEEGNLEAEVKPMHEEHSKDFQDVGPRS
jgi:hypothetical protein